MHCSVFLIADTICTISAFGELEVANCVNHLAILGFDTAFQLFLMLKHWVVCGYCFFYFVIIS